MKGNMISTLNISCTKNFNKNISLIPTLVKLMFNVSPKSYCTEINSNKATQDVEMRLEKVKRSATITNMIIFVQ